MLAPILPRPIMPICRKYISLLIFGSCRLLLLPKYLPVGLAIGM